MDRLNGIYCALWTPADRAGSILWPQLEKHLQFVLRSGVQGLMALGSTGEFPHFTIPERMEILARIIRACAQQSSVRIIANISDIQFRNVVALGKHAKSLGAACAAVLPPWYFAMDQRDLAEFFVQVAREIKIPIALYNYPEVSGTRIELQTIEHVARTVPVVSVKQSGADFSYHHDLLKLSSSLGFDVLTGSDTRLEEALALGCSGAISGLANALPEIFVTVYQNFRQGKSSPRETSFASELARKMDILKFPLNVKAVMAARGLETGELKAPVSATTHATYLRLVDELSRWFSSVELLKTTHSLDLISR